VRKYKFKLEVSVEVSGEEEARLIAIERALDALNDPEALELVSIETRSGR